MIKYSKPGLEGGTLIDGRSQDLLPGRVPRPPYSTAEGTA